MTAAPIPGKDRGETTVQAVLLVPVLLVVLFVGVHAVSLARAGQVAHVAAVRGAEAAAYLGPTGVGAGAARGAALTVVQDLGGILDGPVSVSFNGGRPTVSVRLRISGVVPGMPVTVVRAATVAPETFIESDARR